MSNNKQTAEKSNEKISADKNPETAAVTAESQSSGPRFWLTNDLLAVLLLLSFVGIVTAGGAGFVDLTTVPNQIRTVYLSVVVTAAGWTFGEAAYRTWSGK